MIPDALRRIPEILMNQHAPRRIEANHRHPDRPDGLASGEVLHPCVHGPAEVVIAPGEGRIVERHGHANQFLRGLDEVVPDGGSAVESF